MAQRVQQQAACRRTPSDRLDAGTPATRAIAGLHASCRRNGAGVSLHLGGAQLHRRDVRSLRFRLVRHRPGAAAPLVGCHGRPNGTHRTPQTTWGVREPWRDDGVWSLRPLHEVGPGRILQEAQDVHQTSAGSQLAREHPAPPVVQGQTALGTHVVAGGCTHVAARHGDRTVQDGLGLHQEGGPAAHAPVEHEQGRPERTAIHRQALDTQVEED